MKSSSNRCARMGSLIYGACFAALLSGCAALDAPPSTDLAGMSWRLVKFQGGDGTVLAPGDPSKYTLAFNRDGMVHAHIDCNRGRAAWKSPAPPQLELSPLALTRAACPPGSLHDHIVKQWPYIRSYILKDGPLHMSLLADGGIYEFEPAPDVVGIIKIDSGMIEGAVSGDVLSFKGIPYAAPPVGDLRWRARVEAQATRPR
jgi:heat shock protein HslJ